MFLYMKPIQLTQEHRDKMLEMCKVLFIDYPNLTIRDSMEDFCFKQEHCFIELHNQNEEHNIIHWFEFCLTHLAQRLIEKQFDEGSFFKDALIDNYKDNNPIDFLYEQFKYLKLKA